MRKIFPLTLYVNVTFSFCVEDGYHWVEVSVAKATYPVPAKDWTVCIWTSVVTIRLKRICVWGHQLRTVRLQWLNEEIRCVKTKKGPTCPLKASMMKCRAWGWTHSIHFCTTWLPFWSFTHFNTWPSSSLTISLCREEEEADRGGGGKRAEAEGGKKMGVGT